MQNPSYFTRLPESMELADIGPYFRGLREHYNLSEQDVSSRLHIRVKYIQAIEASDVTQLPGKVYARGYIATYAEFLGIDPEQAVERFLGAETKPKAEEYFIPEPARLGAGLQHKLRMTAVGLVAIGIIYALFGMSSGGDEESIVAPVPDSLVESSRSLVMPIDGSLRCVEGNVLAACLHVNHYMPDSHPLQHPDIFTAPAPWQPKRAVNEQVKQEMPKKADVDKKPKSAKVVLPKEEKKPEKKPEAVDPNDPNALPWLKKKPE